MGRKMYDLKTFRYVVITPSSELRGAILKDFLPSKGAAFGIEKIGRYASQ